LPSVFLHHDGNRHRSRLLRHTAYDRKGRSVDGSRVAVLLLNGATPGEIGFARAAAAANSLYCAG
jgi:hypothetical protein